MTLLEYTERELHKTCAILSNLVYKDKETIIRTLPSELELKHTIDCKGTGTYCFIAIDKQRMRTYLVWRGTNETLDWKSNIRALLVKRPDKFPGKIHKGFYKAIPFEHLDYLIGELVISGYSIINTGHSLGGALATLYAYHVINEFSPANRLPSDVITFGAPKVGNKTMKDEYNKIIRCTRFVHSNDLVPHLPWLFGLFYHHIGDMIFLESGLKIKNANMKLTLRRVLTILFNVKSLINDHFMDSYIDEMI